MLHIFVVIVATFEERVENLLLLQLSMKGRNTFEEGVEYAVVFS